MGQPRREPPELCPTPGRRAVLDVPTAATDHPAAADVLHRVGHIRPGIGPATV
jgi:Fe2+ or Zn2+ uptake regulation protein